MTLATPEPIKEWSLTTLKEKLIKIGAKVVNQARHVAFQMAAVAVPKTLFSKTLRMNAESSAVTHRIDSVAHSGVACPIENGGRGVSG